MKNLFIMLVTVISMNANAANDNPGVNEVVLKVFNTVFESATNISWRSVKGRNEASFIMDHFRVRATFNNKGKLISVLRYYKERELPVNIRYALSETFKGKQIYGVTEYTKRNKVMYDIVLKSDKQITNARMKASGKLLSAKTFNRADI